MKVKQVINNIPMLHFSMTNILEMGLLGVNSQKALNAVKTFGVVSFSKMGRKLSTVKPRWLKLQNLRLMHIERYVILQLIVT